MANKKTDNKKKLSYSKLEDGLCPHFYNEIRNKKTFKKQESIEMIQGLFVHDVTNSYVTKCIKTEVKNHKGEVIEKGIDGDISYMKEIFYNKWKKYGIPEKYYEELKDSMLTFGERGINPDSVIATEKYFNYEFEKGKFIQGYIDILRSYYFRGIKKKGNEPILHIIDYKNSAQILKRQETLTNQLKIYTLACIMELYPNYKYVRRGIYYTKYNTLVMYEDEDNPTHIEDLKYELEETTKMLSREYNKLIDAKEYPAVPGNHCYRWGGCPILHANKCPKIQKVVDFKDIEGTIRKVLQMNTQLKELKKIIQAYIDSNGNVKVDGKEIGYEETEKITYEFEPAYNFCKELVYDLSKEKFPSTIMNKVIKEIFGKINEDDLKKAIDSFKTVTPSTKFKLI